MTPKAILIDRKILSGFHRRALKKLPKEYIEQLWGELREDGWAFIYHTQPMKHSASGTAIWFDDEVSDEVRERAGKYIMLGTIHTHPKGWCFPSRLDIISSAHDGETLFGILAVYPSAGRHYSCYGFWNRRGQPMQLFVGE